MNLLIVLSILGIQLSPFEKSLFEYNKQCWEENYKICYYPSHCIYFTNLKHNENSTLNLKPQLYHYFDSVKEYNNNHNSFMLNNNIHQEETETIIYIDFNSKNSNTSNDWINDLI